MLQVKNKNVVVSILASVCLLLVYASCSHDKSQPALEYMPDMYRSPSYETYSAFENYSPHWNFASDPLASKGTTARLAVEGTVPRGFMPYPYPNTTEGYELAGQNLKNPLVITQEVVDQGKIAYNKFCVSCHGDKGDGNGTIVANEKFPAQPPSYIGDVLMNLPIGKMFHTTEYGKGMMGSHASQVSQEDRWKIISYITTEFQKRTTIQGQATNVTPGIAKVDSLANMNDEKKK